MKLLEMARAVPRHPRTRGYNDETEASLCRERPLVKKGRHRRFEEARKLKQSGPGEFVFEDFVAEESDDDDEYADLARKYGALEEEDEPADDDDA
jgi:hypothetical protein